MSNDQTLIYVLITWVFQNVYFGRFAKLNMRLLLIGQRDLLRKFFGYSCIGIW